MLGLNPELNVKVKSLTWKEKWKLFSRQNWIMKLNIFTIFVIMLVSLFASIQTMIVFKSSILQNPDANNVHYLWCIMELAFFLIALKTIQVAYLRIRLKEALGDGSGVSNA